MNYKPRFLLDVVAQTYQADTVIYFDPDIVVKCLWSKIDQWCSLGIAAVANAVWMMPGSSPIRAGWTKLRAACGVPPFVGEGTATLDIFCNAGFVGVPTSDIAFLELWAALIDAVIEGGLAADCALGGRPGGHPEPDQDLFNLALMSFAERVLIQGPEAMDFAPGGQMLSHAIGPQKPWDKPFVRRALCGFPPSKVDREFLRFAEGPIPVLSRRVVRSRLMAYGVGRGVGAVYRRADY